MKADIARETWGSTVQEVPRSQTNPLWPFWGIPIVGRSHSELPNWLKRVRWRGAHWRARSVLGCPHWRRLWWLFWRSALAAFEGSDVCRCSVCFASTGLKMLRKNVWKLKKHLKRVSFRHVPNLTTDCYLLDKKNSNGRKFTRPNLKITSNLVTKTNIEI